MLSANYGKTLPAPAFAPAAPTTAANTTRRRPRPRGNKDADPAAADGHEVVAANPDDPETPGQDREPVDRDNPAPGSGKTAPSKSAAPKTTSIKVQTPIAPPTPAEPKKPAGKVVSKVVELIATPTKDAKARPAMSRRSNAGWIESLLDREPIGSGD